MRAIWAMIGAVLLASTPAAAQEFSPGYFDNWVFNNRAAEMLRRSHKQIFGEDAVATLRRAPPRVRPPVPPAPAVPRDQVARIAAGFARDVPAADRARATRLFVQLYDKYGELERQLGIRPGDPAGTTAALIAASYMAYADADLDAAHFASLYAQLRGPVATAGTQAQAGEARVTMAILATYLAATREALKTRPDPARSAQLRSAGGSYLRALLGVDPSRVRIGPTGLMLG